MIRTQQNPKEFVVALYTRTNESFPSKLDVMVNGHAGVLVEGQPCVLPRFLVDQAIQSKNFSHREVMNDDPQKLDSYETFAVRPNILITPIPEDYQSPEGIMKFLGDASKIKNPEDPFYRARLGCKNLVYGDMRPAETEASLAVKNSPKAIDMESVQLKADLYEKDKLIKAQGDRLDRLEAMIEKSFGTPAPPKSESYAVVAGDEAERTFEGKVYKTLAAKKAAVSRAEKAEEPEIMDGLAETVEEEAIEVDA
jgi:hypothetical protein